MTSNAYESLANALGADLPEDERKVLTFIAGRLRVGQRDYGDLSIARYPRNPRKELAEELADALVYYTVDILKHDRDLERQLTDVQTRCTELLDETRAQRRTIAALEASLRRLDAAAATPSRDTESDADELAPAGSTWRGRK